MRDHPASYAASDPDPLDFVERDLVLSSVIEPGRARALVIGLGHLRISHAADSSFPSDHLTLWWAVAFSLVLQRVPRIAGVGLALLGFPIAWACIYLGVPFPLDMFGAATVAAISSWLKLREVHWYLEPSYRLASASIAEFWKLIALGWVHE